MVVSVVLTLLVALWVKMTLNTFANQMLQDKCNSSTDEEPEPTTKQVTKQPKPEKPTQADPPTPPQKDEEVPQPPPTQIRPSIPWATNMPPPMPIGTAMFSVEPDPMAVEDSAFENAE